jgi:hypothetical protein
MMTPTATEKSEIAAHRKRYEELKAAGQNEASRALPPPTALDGAPITAGAVIHRETIPAGWYWTTRLDRGEALRLLNPSGSSCASVLAWNRDDPSERLNHADTVKVQWAANLRKGRVIFSDMGRVIFSMIEDTTGGAHDALMGVSTAETNRKKYGGDFRCTRENFVLAAGKFGLDRADIGPSVSFFAPVSVESSGRFVWRDGLRKPGDFVDLRAELDLLVAISNCPHPLDPTKTYVSDDLNVIRYRSSDQDKDDLCRTASAEAKRAFENNAFYLDGAA